MKQFSQRSLYLSIERALGGEITPNLRAVNVEYGEEWICLYFYYDQEPSEHEKETAEVVATEVHVDFDYKIPTIEVRAKKIHLPYPSKIPKSAFLVFQRYEPMPMSNENELLSEFIIGSKITEISRINVLISTEIALLGRVTPNLRCVHGEYGKNFIFLSFYYDQKPSELEEKLADEAREKIAADFKDANLRSLKIHKIHQPFPNLLSNTDPADFSPDTEFCAYHRYEHIPEEDEIS